MRRNIVRFFKYLFILTCGISIWVFFDGTSPKIPLNGLIKLESSWTKSPLNITAIILSGIKTGEDKEDMKRIGEDVCHYPVPTMTDLYGWSKERARFVQLYEKSCRYKQTEKGMCPCLPKTSGKF